MAVSEDDEMIISLSSAAKKIGVDPSTLRRVAGKSLKATWTGSAWVTTMKDVKAWKDNPDIHKPGPKPK